MEFFTTTADTNSWVASHFFPKIIQSPTAGWLCKIFSISVGDMWLLLYLQKRHISSIKLFVYIDIQRSILDFFLSIISCTWSVPSFYPCNIHLGNCRNIQDLLFCRTRRYRMSQLIFRACLCNKQPNIYPWLSILPLHAFYKVFVFLDWLSMKKKRRYFRYVEIYG